MSITILHGDCRDKLKELSDRSVQTVVTSPPYYGLRRYSDDSREIGQEAQPDCLAWARREPPCGACYVCAMREVFAGLWRVLRDDGTCWLNLGDSYAGGKQGRDDDGPEDLARRAAAYGTGQPKAAAKGANGIPRPVPTGLKQKDLLGIPWRVALALQADGWYLRSDIVWSKPNCMPESVTDRPTRAHEYVFLLAKSARYFYDAAAIAEASQSDHPSGNGFKRSYRVSYQNADGTPRGNDEQWTGVGGTRNRRTVWTIATQPYSGAHYATMPEALIEPCILAGSSAQACEHCGAPWVRKIEKKAHSTPVEDRTGRQSHNGTPPQQSGWFWQPPEVTDLGFAPSCACPDNTGAAASIVLDPFGGSGTVGRVALRLQRRAVLIELNGDYIDQHIEKRTNNLQVEMQL